jgi:transposase
MIQLTPQSRIFLATEPVDFRKGIDGLAAVCRQRLGDNPLEGAVYVFRNRSGTSLKLLLYDGQDFLPFVNPNMSKFLPHLYYWLTTNPARIVARAMTQHGH